MSPAKGTSNNGTTPKLTPSKTYNDPSADIVIISSDNHSFRVHSYYLKGASSLFRGILDVQVPNDNKDANRINLGAQGKHVELLLNMVTNSPSAAGKEDPTWPDYKAVIECCRRYGFDGVPLSIVHLVSSRILDAPIEIFAFASQAENIPLAKACIMSFPKTYSNDSHKHFYYRLADFDDRFTEGVASPYCLGLAKAVVACCEGGGNFNWVQIGASFTPVQSTENWGGYTRGRGGETGFKRSKSRSE